MIYCVGRYGVGCGELERERVGERGRKEIDRAQVS